MEDMCERCGIYIDKIANFVDLSDSFDIIEYSEMKALYDAVSHICIFCGVVLDWYENAELYEYSFVEYLECTTGKTCTNEDIIFYFGRVGY